MEESSLTLTAWLRSNKDLVRRTAGDLCRKCTSSDEMVSRLISQLRISMTEAGVIASQLDNLTPAKMRQALGMVEIRLPQVRSVVAKTVVPAAELTYLGYDQDTQEFWAGQPQVLKEAAGKKAAEEVLLLVDLMRGVLRKQNRPWSIGLNLIDVTRAVDSALNGGQIKTLVAGLSVPETKIGIRRQIARALLEDVRVILEAMPNLSEDVGRNQIASVIHCALNDFPPPTDLLKLVAIVLLRRANIEFALLLKQAQWFRRPKV
jgi:hypothetical protein